MTLDIRPATSEARQPEVQERHWLILRGRVATLVMYTGQIELGVGEEGELIVQGPQVMQGYWKAPAATAEALRDGWLYTGDIGWRDEEGYVTITDRKQERLKLGLS